MQSGAAVPENKGMEKRPRYNMPWPYNLRGKKK